MRLTMRCNAAPLLGALDSLAELAERSPQIVQGFLDRVGDTSQLARFDLDLRPAAATGDCRVALEPTDLLREFLLAARAGEIDGV